MKFIFHQALIIAGLTSATLLRALLADFVRRSPFRRAKAEREASTEIAKSADIQYIMRVGFFTHPNTHQSKIQIDCKSYMIKIDIWNELYKENQFRSC